MPPLSLMIKPASGNCNMRCRYCFYADEVQNRKVASYGIMTVETLEKVVCRALERASGTARLSFRAASRRWRDWISFRRSLSWKSGTTKKA